MTRSEFFSFSFYIFSNWSTRRLVLPFRTSRKVLYLSRPCLTFSLWILSMVVSPDSTVVWDSSSLSERSWFCSLSLRSARVKRSSTGSLISSSLSRRSVELSPAKKSYLIKKKTISNEFLISSWIDDPNDKYLPFRLGSSSSSSSFSCTWWWRGVVVASIRAWVASWK